MGGINFLVNAVVGLAANSVVSGVVGLMTGLGAAIALHPVLIATGLLVGGAAIAFASAGIYRPGGTIARCCQDCG